MLHKIREEVACMKFEEAWLTYRRNPRMAVPWKGEGIFLQGEGEIMETAVSEFSEAVQKIFGERLAKTLNKEEAGVCLLLEKGNRTGEEGYEIYTKNYQLFIVSEGEKGILYGVFACIRKLQNGQDLEQLYEKKTPDSPLRMLNHWDNLDGTIERGYSGNSFFFKDNEILINDRTRYYAKLAASVGINGVVINNVNVKDKATWLTEPVYGEKLNQMCHIFGRYGITLYLSLNFAAPAELGELDTVDPLEEKVVSWWQDKMADIFTRLPRLGGFLVKADSEGRPGPFTYGRTQADGANMLAQAVEPYGGKIIWRCFVYNCQQDWRDRKTDRAKAGYDAFMPLDGKFRENVILQVKNGPMDFQIREPVSPLFGGMEHTNQILEVQLAQEYTGQQRHVCYLIPLIKEVLDFRTWCRESGDTVADIVTGKTFGNQACGMAAVANTGNDANWTGHDLAAANFFGFGRLSFDTSLTSEEIAGEWIGCTFGPEKELQETIGKILLESRNTYEKYTSPLGIGWMVNPNHHYGPNVDGYEYDRWGTYHRADHLGLGVERGKEGTGYAQQYREPNASMYDKIETCPQELLLFFHYVPYTYSLNNGKTLIQHIYDTHFEGVEEAEAMKAAWDSLVGRIPEEVYQRVQQRLEHQVWHAKEWRDQINSYFYRKSMIPDEKGRIIY